MQRRVVQWATGGVGRAAIAGIVAHPQLELVGCWVHSEDKVGRDAGELAGIDPTGVEAASDVDALLGLRPDAIVYSPILPDAALVSRMLRSGANVVTPLGWFFPGHRDVGEIEAACREGRTTLHGTGIHPGGITEKFPLMVSALSSQITHVRAEEFSDIRSYDAPFVVGEIMLFGRTPEEAANSFMPALLTDGFSQSIEMIAASLGLDLDGPPQVEHTSAVATHPIPDTPRLASRHDRVGPAPQSRDRCHRQPLRLVDPNGLRRGTRHPDLPGPAPGHRPRRCAPAGVTTAPPGGAQVAGQVVVRGVRYGTVKIAARTRAHA